MVTVGKLGHNLYVYSSELYLCPVRHSSRLFTCISISCLLVLASAFCRASELSAEGRGGLAGGAWDSVRTSMPSKEEILAMDIDRIGELDLDVLMRLSEISGLSIDQLMEGQLTRKGTLASRRTESVLHSPLPMHVITAEDIKASGYTSISELFHLVPGVFVRQKTNGNYDVTFRGMNDIPPENAMIVRENSTLLLMIDNRVVYDQFTGAIFWETLPISINDIQRIEVIQGAASALYGPNAMTGVINIITKHHAVRTGARGMVTYGGHGKADAMLNVGVPIQKFWSTRVTGYLQRAYRFDRDYYSYPGGQYTKPNELLNYFMESPFIDRVSKRKQVLSLDRYGGTASIFYNRDEHCKAYVTEGVDYANVQTAAYNNTVMPLNFCTSRGGFLATAVEANGIHAQASLQGNFLNLDQGKRTPFNTSFRTLAYDALINGDFNLGYGLAFQPELSLRYTTAVDYYSEREYDWECVERGGDASASHPMRFMDGEQELAIAGTSFRLDYRLSRRVRFVGALRYDLYTRIDKEALSWQILASYCPTENHIFRANYSRASRSLFYTSLYANVIEAPVMNTNYELYAKGAPEYNLWFPVLGKTAQFLTIWGNQELEIPLLDFYEVGYRGRFSRWLQVDASVFYQEMQHFDAPIIDSVVADNSIVDPYNKNVYPIIRDYRRFGNLGVRAYQYGVTLSLSSTPAVWLSMRAHMTAQYTCMPHYTVQQNARFIYNGTTHRGQYLFETRDRQHYETPALFGGMNFRFSPLASKRLIVDVNARWRTNQICTYAKIVRDVNPYLRTEIPWTLLADISVSYNLLPSFTIFATIQNIGRAQVE